MAIGFYVFASGIIFLLSRALLVPSRFRSVYSFLVLPLVGLGLLVYVTSSVLVGVRIYRFGQAATYSVPEDYLALGTAGWAVMIVAVLGILSPLLAAMLVPRR
jgi:hypothetical protein